MVDGFDIKKSQYTILAMINRYLPGYKGGGPTRSLVNLAERLGGEFNFRIITLDRDSGDPRQYVGITVNCWQPVNKALVYYVSPRNLSISNLKHLMLGIEYDVLYLNSFFSYAFTIKPLILRRLGLIKKTPIVLAPRGEFSQGALAIKGFKKQLFLRIAGSTGLYRDVVWQASSEHEANDINRWFSNDNNQILIAPNLFHKPSWPSGFERRQKKTEGRLKVVFLSRISQKKNLEHALEMFKKVKGEVQFNIYGPLEDVGYWEKCQKTLKLLPENVHVRYRGAVPHDRVANIMAEHDLFFLPTRGENFGHVILEALVAGCPVLISNQTPWRNLEEKGVGWDIPLDNLEYFRSVLQQCVDMNEKDHQMWSQRARNYSLQVETDGNVVRKNVEIFKLAIDGEINKCAV